MLVHTCKASLAVLAVIGAASFSTVSFAAGSGDSNAPIPSCKKGTVWDSKAKKCKKIRKSGQLDDDNIYEAARDLAYNRRYQEAIDLLNLAENKKDPRILNYLGYSNRKLGRIHAGLTYYTAALKEDPDYTLVMEYMGEAFLQLGEVDKAREQLAQIEKRCGKNCREYSMLEGEINRHIAQ
jgi:tetratricopeptide (TPR) repeat protein